ncbi:MAG TPA: hypothetical protein VGI14_06570 [Casimicrobiaceae bacterium]
MIYLIEYDRQSGKLIAIEEFEEHDRVTAEDIRLEKELRLLRDQKLSHEVVLLEASNAEELHKTHRRYFERIDQLIAQ